MKVMLEKPTVIRQRLADNMRRLRKQRGWSQGDLERVTGLHHNQISAMERCKQSVGIDIIERLAWAFEVDVGALLDYQEPPE